MLRKYAMKYKSGDTKNGYKNNKAEGTIENNSKKRRLM